MLCTWQLSNAHWLAGPADIHTVTHSQKHLSFWLFAITIGRGQRKLKMACYHTKPPLSTFCIRSFTHTCRRLSTLSLHYKTRQRNVYWSITQIYGRYAKLIGVTFDHCRGFGCNLCDYCRKNTEDWDYSTDEKQSGAMAQQIFWPTAAVVFLPLLYSLSYFSLAGLSDGAAVCILSLWSVNSLFLR